MKSRDAATETYTDVERLIAKLVWKYSADWGPFRDSEEIRAEANLVFVKAFHEYDRSRSEFTTCLQFKIWKWFQNRMRKHYAELHRMRMETANLNLITRKQSRFHLPDLIDELSSDAATIVRLIVDTPNDLRHILKHRHSGTAINVRWALAEFLKDLGWTVERITESFTEIKEALR